MAVIGGPSSIVSANIQMAMQQMNAQAQMQTRSSNLADPLANAYRPGAIIRTDSNGVPLFDDLLSVAPSPEMQRAAVRTLGESAEAVIDRCYFWMEFAAVPVVSIAARWMLDKLADRLNAMADDMERRLPA